MPDAIKYEQYLEWVINLPDNETPEWCGLPNNV
jgi:hypothetical protein